MFGIQSFFLSLPPCSLFLLLFPSASSLSSRYSLTEWRWQWMRDKIFGQTYVICTPYLMNGETRTIYHFTIAFSLQQRTRLHATMYTFLIYFILLPCFFFLAILSLHFCRLHLICDKNGWKITVVINRCMSRSIPKKKFTNWRIWFIFPLGRIFCLKFERRI